MTDAALLAQNRRGDVLEAVIRGHVAVAGADGRLQAWAGDPHALTTVRSTVKAIQAQPFIANAAGALGCPVDEIAVACGSHGGEPRHVATVRALLARAGIDESALTCGRQAPYDTGAERELLSTGRPFLPVHNNCSGKHAAMLATCVVEGWPLEGYAMYDHPIQAAVRRSFRDVAGCDLNSAPVGIDGCGAPTYGLEVAVLARAFAAACHHQGFRRCQDAMAAEPFLVGGTGRFDTALLEAAGDRITAKSGGAGVWAAVIRPDGPGIAVKIEAGAGEYLAPVSLAVMQALGVLPADLPESLRRFARPALENLTGTVVGSTEPALRLVFA